MDSKRVQRRLAAILAIDVVGYSRLMGADEVATLNVLKSHRRECLDPNIARHNGRVVKTAGDGILIEFASVVDAVACAVAVQVDMLARNSNISPDRRMVLRIGVNLGDVIVDGDDIFGDGVNVAARLQGICEPGGVCISRAAREQVRDKLGFAFADLGEHDVKNIARPVRAFGLGSARIADIPRHSVGAALEPSEASIADADNPVLTLPDKPSIAVLPFANMSGDPSQEYFADGMVEDIITASAASSGFS